MCAILIPALIGVGALAVLGGGGIGGNSCGTASCAPTSGGYTVTIPQENGVVTNGIASQQMAPQYAYAAPQQPMAYAGQQMAPPPMAPQGYNNQVGAGVNYNSQSIVGADGYANPNGLGVGANVGGVNAGVGLGYPQSY